MASTSSTSVRRRGGPSKGDQREAEIVRATRKLLDDRSLDALTIDDIAAAAGISRTTFYFYFPTKQAVIAALLEGLWDEFGNTHEWLASSGPDRDGLREHHRRVAEIWRKHEPILKCTTVGDLDYPPLKEWADNAHERFASALAAKITRDQADGTAPAGVGPRELAELVSELRDHRFATLARMRGSQLEHGLNDLTEVVLRMIYGAC